MPSIQRRSYILVSTVDEWYMIQLILFVYGIPWRNSGTRTKTFSEEYLGRFFCITSDNNFYLSRDHASNYTEITYQDLVDHY